MSIADDRSGVSPSAVALPKGGGAFFGMGETYHADLHTGTYLLTVPLHIPPGRRGHAPDLALSYSSAAGTGVFGLGWSLSVGLASNEARSASSLYEDSITQYYAPGPGDSFAISGDTSGRLLARPTTTPVVISRSTRKGIPLYTDEDEFLLGSQELLRVSEWATDASGTDRMHYKVPGLTASDEITRCRDAQDEWWEVVDHNANTTRLGRTVSSRVSWPQPRHRDAYAWHVTDVTDVLGNKLEYSYVEDQGDNQIYLESLRYVQMPSAGGWLYRVSLDYGPEGQLPRPDAFSTFRSGFEIRTTRLCRSVCITLHADNYEAGTALGRYELSYNLSGGNDAALLSRIQHVGVYEGAEEREPPLHLTYTALQPWDGAVDEEARVQGGLAGGADLLDGEGLAATGVVVPTPHGHELLAGHPERGLQPGKPFTAPQGVSLADPLYWLADMNGNGSADLVYVGRPGGKYEFSPEVGWSTTPVILPGESPDPGGGNCRFLDLDGDGVIDALTVVGGEFRAQYNLGEAGWSAGQSAPFPLDLRAVDLRDPRVRFADFSGDGPLDLVMIAAAPSVRGDPGRCGMVIKYWPHYGRARFGSKARIMWLPTWQNSRSEHIDPLVDLEPRRLLLTDVDGDGFSDVVYVRAKDIFIWLNQSGNRLSPPIRLELRGGQGPRNSRTELDSLRIADFKGTGSRSAVWTHPQTEKLQVTRLAGDEKPYLLCGVDNSRGARVTVQYRSAATFAFSDRDSDRRWSGHLPFPVYVVSSVSVTDVYSGNSSTSSYEYHEGTWDGAEREFCGFGLVDQYDAELRPDPETLRDPYWSPPTLTRTWFHTGQVGESDSDDAVAQALTGNLKGAWAGDSRLITPPASTATWLEGLRPQWRRRVARSLVGLKLRVEEYTTAFGHLEGEIPAAVTEYAYDLRPSSHVAVGGTHELAPVVLAAPRGIRLTKWESGSDPLTRLTLYTDHDTQGRPRVVADIAVPRGRDPWLPADDAESFHCRLTCFGYTHATSLRLNRVASKVQYTVLETHQADLAGLVNRIERRQVSLEPVAATLTYYDGEPFGADAVLGACGSFGLPTRVEQLVLTPSGLEEIGVDRGLPEWLGSGLATYAPSSPQVSSPAYPEEFLASLASSRYFVKAGDDVVPAGLYMMLESSMYDVQQGAGWGLLIARRDAAGTETSVTYDAFGLQPESITTGATLQRTYRYDYRTQAPTEATDFNGDATVLTYTPLGYPKTVLRSVKQELGDTHEAPGIVYEHGLDAAARTLGDGKVGPVWTHRIVRTADRQTVLDLAARQMAGQPRPAMADAPLLEEPLLHPDRFLETREYTDGLGRRLQTRTRVPWPVVTDLGLAAELSPGCRPVTVSGAEGGPEPRVQVSDRCTFDNKGRLVAEYDPEFAIGWDFQEDAAAPARTIARDPRGRPVVLRRADGAERRFIYGSVADPTRPERYVPSPWECYEYDEDDNAARTHPDRPEWHKHVDTPTRVELNAQGRVTTLQEQTADGHLVTRLRRGFDGQVLQAWDALGRPAYSAVFDSLGRLWRETTLDAGTCVTFLGPRGETIERRDSRGVVAIHAYDHLHRRSRTWHSEDGSSPFLLHTATVFGDDPSAPADAALKNLRGRPWQSYDKVGLTVVDAYNANGDPLAVERRSLSAADIGALLESPRPLRAPWPHGGAHDLAIQGSVVLRRDRLGRVLSVDCTAPLMEQQSVAFVRDSIGKVTQVLTDSRNGTGSSSRADGFYDAGGRLIALRRDNGLLTRYLLDPRTGFLRRQRTEATDVNAAAVVHDVCVTHSAGGAPLLLDEETAWSGRRTISVEYDDLGRLIEARGHVAPQLSASLWQAAAPAQKGGTGESLFEYDAVGNLQSATTGTSGGPEHSRAMTLLSGTNRLSAMRVGNVGSPGQTVSYSYDESGNVVSESQDVGQASSRTFGWNHSGLLTETQVTTPGGPARTVQWYDDEAQLACVASRKPSGELLLMHCVGGWLHVFETVSSGRLVASRERVVPITVEGVPGGTLLGWLRGEGMHHFAFRHAILDQLGSQRAVMDEQGDTVSSCDYTPFGEVIPYVHSSEGVPRPLAFAGSTRDDASGLLVLGSRPYAPWAFRFFAPETTSDQRDITRRALGRAYDPTTVRSDLTPGVATSPYVYAGNSPLGGVDVSGRTSYSMTVRLPERFSDHIRDAGAGIMLGGGLIAVGGLVTGNLPLAGLGVGAVGLGSALMDFADYVDKNTKPDPKPPQPEPGKASPSTEKPSTGDPQQSDPTKSEAAKPEPAKPESAKPASDRPSADAPKTNEGAQRTEDERGDPKDSKEGPGVGSGQEGDSDSHNGEARNIDDKTGVEDDDTTPFLSC